MAIKFAKNFRLTLLLLTVQFAASIHGATLISRAPNDPALYALNPQAVAFHQNCMANNPQNSAETMQDFIQRAWSGALELAAAAQTRFTNTRGILGDDGDPPMSGLTHSIIDGSDPGWVQFFKLDYTASTVLYARQIWSGITGRINNNPGEGARPNSKITIICGPVNGLTPSWEDSCRDTPQGKVLAGMRSLKDQNSDTLYICPAFYQTDRFDLFKAATEPGAAPDQNGVTAAVFAKVRQLAGQQGTDGKSRSLFLRFSLPPLVSPPLLLPSSLHHTDSLTPQPKHSFTNGRTYRGLVRPTPLSMQMSCGQCRTRPKYTAGLSAPRLRTTKTLATMILCKTRIAMPGMASMGISRIGSATITGRIRGRKRSRCSLRREGRGRQEMYTIPRKRLEALLT